MTQEIKSLGMIHIPGVNDEAYATYINNLPIVEDNNLWYHIPSPDYLSYAEQARHREKSGFGM
jgi:hypothetical protein